MMGGWFDNFCPAPRSIHPHRAQYGKNDESDVNTPHKLRKNRWADLHISNTHGNHHHCDTHAKSLPGKPHGVGSSGSQAKVFFFY